MTSPDVPPVPEPGAPTEPLITVGTITALVTTGLALLVAFGIPVSDDRQAAILGVIGVVAPLVVMAIGRARVFAPATVRRMIAQAKAGQG